MKLLGWLFGGAFGLALLILGAALTFGTAPTPPELKSVSSPFKSVDFSDLPPIRTLDVPHGSSVAYRTYGPHTAAEVVLALHGSTGSSASLHPLSKALAAAGMTVYAPDIRGHGATGKRGDIDYRGQIDSDMARLVDFIRTAHPAARLSLVGHSLGGGLALRMAAQPLGARFAQALLIAPALGPQSPTQRRGNADPWARPHIARIIAISFLNRVGLHMFDGLSAIEYAVPLGSDANQTRRYSYRMLLSLIPTDHRELLRMTSIPLKLVIAENDEMFAQDAFAPAILPHKPDARISTIRGVDHIGVTLDPAALGTLIGELRTPSK